MREVQISSKRFNGIESLQRNFSNVSLRIPKYSNSIRTSGNDNSKTLAYNCLFVFQNFLLACQPIRMTNIVLHAFRSLLFVSLAGLATLSRPFLSSRRRAKLHELLPSPTGASSSARDEGGRKGCGSRSWRSSSSSFSSSGQHHRRDRARRAQQRHQAAICGRKQKREAVMQQQQLKLQVGRGCHVGFRPDAAMAPGEAFVVHRADPSPAARRPTSEGGGHTAAGLSPSIHDRLRQLNFCQKFTRCRIFLILNLIYLYHRRIHVINRLQPWNTHTHTHTHTWLLFFRWTMVRAPSIVSHRAWIKNTVWINNVVYFKDTWTIYVSQYIIWSLEGLHVTLEGALWPGTICKDSSQFSTWLNCVYLFIVNPICAQQIVRCHFIL